MLEMENNRQEAHVHGELLTVLQCCLDWDNLFVFNYYANLRYGINLTYLNGLVFEKIYLKHPFTTLRLTYFTW